MQRGYVEIVLDRPVTLRVNLKRDARIRKRDARIRDPRVIDALRRAGVPFRPAVVESDGSASSRPAAERSLLTDSARCSSR
jgi:hypothetical protein